MSMLITWTMGALALVSAQDEGRAAAVRAQIEQDVKGKASAELAPLPQAARAEDPILALLLQLEQDPKELAANARTKLRQLGNAVRPILPRYLGKLSPIALRETLEFLLDEAPDADAVVALERMLDGADPVARVVVARCVADVRGPARAALIDRALASADVRVRQEALRALGSVAQTDPRLATAVVELARSTNSEERRLAAELSGSVALRDHVETGKVVDALVADADPDVRTKAIEAWLERSEKLASAEALAFYERLASEAERQLFLRSALRRERPWPQFYDHVVDQVVRCSADLLSSFALDHLQELSPKTLVACAEANPYWVNKVLSELQRRGNRAGVDLAVAALTQSSGDHFLEFEYLRALAPERLVPLGKHLISQHWTQEFYESRADADTVRAVIDIMRSYRYGHDARALQNIVRDRSDTTCFEALLEAVPQREPNQSDAPWTGAVRAALVRLAGPEQIAIVLQRCTEIDDETLQNVLDALRPHWTLEHAPLLVAAAERYVAMRGSLRDSLADVLATRVGPAGRAALRGFIEGPKEHAGFRAWRALIRSADAEEQRTLLLRALAPDASSLLAENALESYALVIAADAELRNLATPWFARGLATEVLMKDWPRLVPPDQRSAEVRQLVAALRSNKNGHVRTAAVMMLGYLRGPEVVAEIAPFLDDPATKNNAILALQQIGERAGVPLIIECLRDPAEQTRTQAKEALEVLEHYFEAKSRWEKGR